MKVLVVDDDGIRRAILVDLLGGLNHEVRAVSRSGDVLDAHLAQSADVLVASGTFGGVAGVELAARLRATPRPPAVVLVMGAGDAGAEGLARGQGIPLRGCLTWPPDPAVLAALLQTPVVAASPAQADWSGLAFLETVRGPTERFPVPRLLFLAHRVAATGALLWSSPAGSGAIHLRSGGVVQVEGVPGLFDTVDGVPGETTDLNEGLGIAVRSGNPYGAVIEAVTTSLASWLVDPSAGEGGTVWFEPNARPPAGAFALPTPIPRLISQGLSGSRTVEALERRWEARGASSMHVRVPDDSPESRWGLDATALRVLKLASESPSVSQLLAAATGRDRQRLGAVLRAVELLALLGLLAVDGGAHPAEDAPSGPPPAAAPRAAAPPRVPPPPPSRTPAAATQEDSHAVRLRSALAAMEGAHPMDLLGLGDRVSVTEAEISSAYRDVSRRFHPDTYFNSSPVVRGLAEACFARVNGAYESLSAPGGLAEAQRFIAFRKAGRGFVSEREHQTARVSFKRAELLFKNRDWKGADALYLEAARMDDSTWPHLFHAIRCGALARRLTVAQASDQLEALTPPTPAARADVLVAIGNLHKLDGKHAEAMRRYRQALEADPANRDAQRELRLHQSRNEQDAASVAPARSAGATISGFFRRGSDPK